MNTPLGHNWRHEFARHAARTREQQRLFDEAERRRREKNHQDDGADHDFMDVVTSMVMADPADVAEFRVELDDYQADTVELLQRNDQALDRVQAKIREMLDQAYVLPDGRRVFKMEDGIQVVDEHGKFVNATVITPDQIEDWRPKGEAFLLKRQQRIDLQHERQDLLQFQHKLDQAGKALDDPDLTADQLAKIKNDIKDARPAALLGRMEMPKQGVGSHLPADGTPGADSSSDTPKWLADIKPLQPF